MRSWSSVVSLASVLVTGCGDLAFETTGEQVLPSDVLFSISGMISAPSELDAALVHSSAPVSALPTPLRDQAT